MLVAYDGKNGYIMGELQILGRGASNRVYSYSFDGTFATDSISVKYFQGKPISFNFTKTRRAAVIQSIDCDL